MVGDYSQATVIPEGEFAGRSISAFAVGAQENELQEDMLVPGNGLDSTGGKVELGHASKAAAEQAEQAEPEAHPAVPPRAG